MSDWGPEGGLEVVVVVGGSSQRKLWDRGVKEAWRCRDSHRLSLANLG